MRGSESAEVHEPISHIKCTQSKFLPDVISGIFFTLFINYDLKEFLHFQSIKKTLLSGFT